MAKIKENQQVHYEGKPCVHGHGTLRYTYSKRCVECTRIGNKSWISRNEERYKASVSEWYHKNKERVLSDKKIKRENPEEAARIKERKRIYRLNNLQKINEKRRYIKKMERHKIRKIKNNLEKASVEEIKSLNKFETKEALNSALRRSRINGNIIELTAEQAIELVYKRNKGCSYCRSHEKLHLDHKTPLSKGGGHTAKNLQWLCQFHNLSKGKKTHEQYVIWCAAIGDELPMLENESAPKKVLSEKAEVQSGLSLIIDLLFE